MASMALALTSLTAPIAITIAPGTATAASALVCSPGTQYVFASNGNFYPVTVATGATGASAGNFGAVTGLNAFGIGPGGTMAYAVVQTPTGTSDSVYALNVTTGVVTKITVTVANGQQQLAGAVNPVNGIFYFGGYANPGTGASQFDVYAINPTTLTQIGNGVMATAAAPNDSSGDFAFDSQGNLYAVGSGTANTVYKVTTPLPTTFPPTPVVLSATAFATVGAGQFGGLALDSNGLLYAGSTGPALTPVNTITGAVGAVINLTGQPGGLTYNDLASCNVTGSLTVAKFIGARVNPGDQFTVTATASTTTVTGTTSGSTTGLQTNAGAEAGPVIGTTGVSYTVSEAAAGTANLTNYQSSYSCVDQNTSSVVVSGNGTTATFTFPAVDAGGGAVVLCTFTNTPGLTIAKTASPSTVSTLGATITYSFVVKNVGAVTYNNISVNDTQTAPAGSLLSGPTCPSTTLAGNTSMTCTATYKVTQADLDNGSIKDTATASAVTPLGAPYTSGPSSATVTVEQDPSISVVKGSTTPSFSAVGDVITFTFLVSNTGNVTLHGDTVNDLLPGVSSRQCPTNTLAPGDSTTCTATYTVTQADLDTGSVFNAATVTGNTPQGTAVTSPESDVTVPAIQSGSLSIVKTASPTTFSSVGTTITYSFHVTNNGNVTEHAIQTVDAMAGLSAITCGASTLAPGDSTDCAATYVTTQADLDAGKIVNTADATGLTPLNDPTTSNEATAEVDALQSPGLSVAKTASVSTFSSVGTTITYTITVTDTGNVTEHNIQLNDPLSGLSGLDCAATTLSPNESTTCTATYVTTQADLDAGQVVNTVTGTALTPEGATVPSNEASVTVTAIQTATLFVTKTANVSSFTAAGQTITFTVSVQNTGNVDMTNIVVHDNLAGVGTFTCDATSVAPGASATCTAPYVTTQADVDAGHVINTAYATGDDPSENPITSNTAQVTVPAIPSPSITVTKTANVSSFDAAGQTIVFSFLVTNSGNQTLHGVNVTDVLAGVSTPSCPSDTLAPAASETCTASYVTTQADVDTGSVFNTASSHATSPADDTVSSSPSSVTVPADQKPGISLLKTALEKGFTAAGETIHYVFSATNTGNVTLTGLTLSDTLTGLGLSAVSCPISAKTLAPGVSVTCTATYVTTTADVLAAEVTNTATASAFWSSPELPLVSGTHAATPHASNEITSPPSTVVVPLVATPTIGILTTANIPFFTAAGTKIDYNFLVTNSGSTPLSQIRVTANLKGLSVITCPAVQLPLGASMTCTATYFTTKTDLSAKKVSISAISSGFSPLQQHAVSHPSGVVIPALIKVPVTG